MIPVPPGEEFPPPPSALRYTPASGRQQKEIGWYVMRRPMRSRVRATNGALNEALNEAPSEAPDEAPGEAPGEAPMGRRVRRQKLK